MTDVAHCSQTPTLQRNRMIQHVSIEFRASHGRRASRALRRDASRSTATSPASTNSPASPAAGCTGAIPSARSIPTLLRLLCACALSAPSKSDLQQADIVILDKPEQARDRRSHSRPAVHPHRAGVPGVPGQRPAAAGNLQDARQAVSQRPSRPVLQRRGRCRHRARDLPRRRRRGRARHLPDQRDPRSFRQGERDARAAAAGDPGRRHVRRLAVGAGPHQPAAVARRARCTRAATTRAISPRASTPTTAAAPRSIPTSRAIRRAGARSPFYGWSEDKARQYGVPQRADFGAFVRKKGFCLD